MKPQKVEMSSDEGSNNGYPVMADNSDMDFKSDNKSKSVRFEKEKKPRSRGHSS